MTFLLAALPYAKRFWYVVPIAILVVMLLVARGDARHWHKIADRDSAALQLEVSKNRVNLASIDTLQAALDQKDAESDQRAKALNDAKSANAANEARFDQMQKADATRIDTLKRMVQTLPDSGCKAPEALIANLKGL